MAANGLDHYIGAFAGDAAADAAVTTYYDGLCYRDTDLGVIKKWDGAQSAWVPVGSSKAFFTPEGGLAILLTNDTGSASVKGTLVEASTSTDDAFDILGAGDPHPIGVVYESGVADGSECFVVTGGIAEVLIEDGTAATHGYWAAVGLSDNGRADITNAAPPGGGIPELDRHMEEIGHCLESAASGTDVLVRILMHFN